MGLRNWFYQYIQFGFFDAQALGCTKIQNRSVHNKSRNCQLISFFCLVFGFHWSSPYFLYQLRNHEQHIQTLSQTLKSLSHTRISYPMIQITSYLDKRKQQQQANRLLGCVLENKSRLNLLILPAARLGPSTWQLSDTALNHSRFSPRTSCPICWCWMLCFPSATRFTDVAKKKKNTNWHHKPKTDSLVQFIFFISQGRMADINSCGAVLI